MVNDITTSAEDLGFDSRIGQVKVLPTAPHRSDFFFWNCVAPAEMGPATRSTLRRVPASMNFLDVQISNIMGVQEMTSIHRVKKCTCLCEVTESYSMQTASLLYAVRDQSLSMIANNVKKNLWSKYQYATFTSFLSNQNRAQDRVMSLYTGVFHLMYRVH